GRRGPQTPPPPACAAGFWSTAGGGPPHDTTGGLRDEGLIYTANIYGPIQFDDGPGTPISAVMSWMQYKAAAVAAGHPLVANVFDGDASLLAWSPLGATPQPRPAEPA
ncbi:MAG: hypothetical protein OXP08_12525, partial [bacterium]|nr:hypothetical protein [bacterium]